MSLELLQPISLELLHYAESLPADTVGRKAILYSDKKTLPERETTGAVLLGIRDTRQGKFSSHTKFDFLHHLRKQLYSLFWGNWSLPFYDLGDLPPGAMISDTYVALKDISTQLMGEGHVVICLGGARHFSYACYRSFDGIAKMVNMVSVSSRLELSPSEKTDDLRFMSRILTEKPYNLFNYTNLGYQTYLNSQEEIDLIDRLFFEAHRLGELKNNIELSETVMRSAAFVSIDITAIKAIEKGWEDQLGPNGFDEMEFCILLRYAGLSNELRFLGLFELPPSSLYCQLASQAIWYFLEGLNLRIEEDPMEDKYIQKYIIALDSTDLEFRKSLKSGRWWMRILTSISAIDNNSSRLSLLPCTEEEYLESCDGQIPERLWRATKRLSEIA